MLTEERFKLILSILEKKQAVTVIDLVDFLNVSESTIRRDLTTLNSMGKLKKVHGGATSIRESFSSKDDDVDVRQNSNVEEKEEIARYAASLIRKNDFVYIDAGTSTEKMIEYISEKRANYVTNGIAHGKKLAKKGFKVYIVGGEIKLATEAIVGVEAVNSLRKYNFTKGFFGVNAISEEQGYSTPDVQEALVKESAMKKSRESYILADSSKFNKTSCVTFGELSDATIITTNINDDEVKDYTKVVEVNKI